MSKLTDECLNDILHEVYGFRLEQWELEAGGGLPMAFARAIESAATEPLLQRIAEFEANEKVLLAQIQGHTQWREKIIRASEQAYGESAIRYKFSLTKTGKCMNTFPKEIDGRWFALVPAEDDGHIGHIARIAELEQWQAEHWNALQIIDNYLVSKNLLQVIEDGGPEAAARNVVHSIAELEQRIEAGKNIVRNDMHRIGQLQAQVTELERQLEEARKNAERYRWLRANWFTMTATYHDGAVQFFVNGPEWLDQSPDTVDAAIDAAMQKGQP